MDYLNVALFDNEGRVARIVSGPKAQVDENVRKWTKGAAYELPLIVSEIDQVPPEADLESDGKRYE